MLHKRTLLLLIIVLITSCQGRTLSTTASVPNTLRKEIVPSPFGAEMNVVFVVSQSGNMHYSDGVPGRVPPSRFDVVQDAVRYLVGLYTQFLAPVYQSAGEELFDLSIGAVYFNQRTQIVPLSDNADHPGWARMSDFWNPTTQSFNFEDLDVELNRWLSLLSRDNCQNQLGLDRDDSPCAQGGADYHASLQAVFNLINNGLADNENRHTYIIYVFDGHVCTAQQVALFDCNLTASPPNIGTPTYPQEIVQHVEGLSDVLARNYSTNNKGYLHFYFMGAGRVLQDYERIWHGEVNAFTSNTPSPSAELVNLGDNFVHSTNNADLFSPTMIGIINSMMDQALSPENASPYIQRLPVSGRFELPPLQQNLRVATGFRVTSEAGLAVSNNPSGREFEPLTFPDGNYHPRFNMLPNEQQQVLRQTAEAIRIYYEPNPVPGIWRTNYIDAPTPNSYLNLRGNDRIYVARQGVQLHVCAGMMGIACAAPVAQFAPAFQYEPVNFNVALSPFDQDQLCATEGCDQSYTPQVIVTSGADCPPVEAQYNGNGIFSGTIQPCLSGQKTLQFNVSVPGFLPSGERVPANATLPSAEVGIEVTAINGGLGLECNPPTLALYPGQEWSVRLILDAQPINNRLFSSLDLNTFILWNAILQYEGASPESLPINGRDFTRDRSAELRITDAGNQIVYVYREVAQLGRHVRFALAPSAVFNGYSISFGDAACIFWVQDIEVAPPPTSSLTFTQGQNSQSICFDISDANDTAWAIEHAAQLRVRLMDADGSLHLLSPEPVDGSSNTQGTAHVCVDLAFYAIPVGNYQLSYQLSLPNEQVVYPRMSLNNGGWMPGPSVRIIENP